MITKFITDVSTKFNPFNPRAKTARVFLSLLPPNARQTMKVNTLLLPKTSRERSNLLLKFILVHIVNPNVSMGIQVFLFHEYNVNETRSNAEDGKTMQLDPEKLGIKEVMEEVDRHSRILSRQEELTGN
ncbi:MAG: 39S ribosomal protein L44, mitochondrial [Candelina submexicana]|nr:MAG: 39S ribosomal protein L44, mitochondrial [Candelina submexicana]